MRQLASYINDFTQISSVQLSSGFYPVQERKPGQVPPSSSWARLLDSNRPGELRLQFEAVKAAYLYEMQLASELDETGQPLWRDLDPAPRAARSAERRVGKEGVSTGRYRGATCIKKTTNQAPIEKK